MEYKCKSCGQEFEMDLQERNLYGDVEEMYFVCSHCDWEYSATFTNGYIRKKNKQISKAMRNGDRPRVKKLMREIAEMMEQLKSEVQRWREGAEKEAELVIHKTANVGRTETAIDDVFYCRKCLEYRCKIVRETTDHKQPTWFRP